MTIVIEVVLAAVVTIVFATLEWQTIRGNRLVNDTKESMNEMRRQQNDNAQSLENKLNGLLGDINKDIEKTANSSYMLSQNLRDSLVSINAVLAELRQTNLQLLAKIEVLNEKVENGNGHRK